MPTPSTSGKPADRKPKKAKASSTSEAAAKAAATKALSSAESRRAAGVAAAQSVPLTSGAADPYAPTAWGATPLYEDVRCPSGQMALCRRPGVQGLILAGALEEMDSLSAVVDKKHIKRVKGEETVDVDSLMGDTDQIKEVLAVADRVVQYIVVKPPLTLPPADEADRVDGVLYVDMVDMEDRLFLMNFAVGGTRDAESFRIERAEALGSLVDGNEVPVSA